ncbi:MAG TPA: DUF420 domain-containing protein [Verrucomicrobiota bacterium]|nr:DUF420 domain-containing protein [Verrucomicrobiales bacterium]HRI12344.1 DUF420 domain-containing protein [Verrucomicrobiota bacterium]
MNGADLPAINAALNGLVTVLLLAGWFYVRTGRRLAHRNCMLAAFVTSSLFLISYLYHKIVVMQGINTLFPGPPALRIPYLILLVTHVILAMAIVPMALISIHRGLKERFELHKKIVRWTLPLWLYVSVTGVLIYFLLYQVWPKR